MKRTSKILFGLFFGVVTIFWFYPFIIVFINALKGKKGIFQNPLWFTRDFTFTNFKTAYQALYFTNSFFNSLVITVASVITITCVSAAAYALSRVKGPFSSFFYYLCAGTMLIPFQSIMIPLLSIFGKINFLNRTSLIIMNTGLSISLSIILFVYQLFFFMAPFKASQIV